MSIKPTLKHLLTILIATNTMTSCFMPHSSQDDNKYDITEKFGLHWNAEETVNKNDDGSITFHAKPWGGLAASMVSVDGPADLTQYESLVAEFSQPTHSYVQFIIDGKLVSWGKAGLTRLECLLYGTDVSHVQQMALMFAKEGIVNVKRIYLTKASYEWETTRLWEGNCKTGNWENEFTIRPEKFDIAVAGDMLEIKSIKDNDSPDTGYWQIKTIIEGTDDTLIGNQDNINEWGCATVDRGSCSLLIPLTARDVARLQNHGLRVCGFYKVVTQVNLLQ